MEVHGKPGHHAPRIVILGAGCTGLGAAYRLHQLGHEGFLVLEAKPRAGGLASSFVDSQGFTWDLGGHVQFSHYAYFDDLMDQALPGAWLHHTRESYIWLRDRFVPYPLQNNLRHLPPDDLSACLKGLLRAQRDARDQSACESFHDWILRSFGQGIADLFLFPYNFKVWAHPLERLSRQWIGERVATVDVERVLDAIIFARDDRDWGPNRSFRFPVRGGTGAIWEAVAAMIPRHRFRYNSRITRIDSQRRIACTAAGQEYPYDILISTLPLDVMANLLGEPALVREAAGLEYSTTHVMGIGLRGQPGDHLAAKSWMYFPEADCPFYRVTVFSNYSPNHTPRPGPCWSLMAEVSQSPFKPVTEESLGRQVIQGMLATRLIRPEDEILSVWRRRIRRGYPVPTVGRDERVHGLLAGLEKRAIYSRGRFGAWKYEVSNQDHSCMQGVELVDRLLSGAPEPTLFTPALVNNGSLRASPGRFAAVEPTR